MKMNLASNAILLLLLIAGSESRLGIPDTEGDNRKLGALIEIMNSPPAERLYPGVSNAKQTGNCRLRLNTGGNLMVERLIPGQGFRTAWHSGDAGTGEYFMAMQVDGNVVVYRENGPGGSDNDVVFATGSNHGTDKNYKLYLDQETCALSVSSVSVYWQSLNSYALSQNANPLSNTLKKGNLYKNPHSPELTMYLQRDCNLIIFEGNDLADKGDVVWASDTRDLSLDNCHLSVDHEQDRPVLYGDTNEVLWESESSWPEDFVLCLSEAGPFPCNYDGNPLSCGVYPVCNQSAIPFDLDGSVDIGAVTAAGGSVRCDPWSYTVKGSGRVGCDDNAVGTCPDALHFAYKRISGDFMIKAKVCKSRLVDLDAINGRSGIMIRESLDPGAKHRFNGYTANSVYHNPSSRIETDGPVTVSDPGVADTYCWWMSMTRLRNEITTNFTESFGADEGNSPEDCISDEDEQTFYRWVTEVETIDMADEALVGLAVTSYNDDPGSGQVAANEGLGETNFRHIHLEQL